MIIHDTITCQRIQTILALCDRAPACRARGAGRCLFLQSIYLQSIYLRSYDQTCDSKSSLLFSGCFPQSACLQPEPEVVKACACGAPFGSHYLAWNRFAIKRRSSRIGMFCRQSSKKTVCPFARVARTGSLEPQAEIGSIPSQTGPLILR